jgi:hypothetical protein
MVHLQGAPVRTRGAAVQGGLAALGLVAAWGTWQREPEKAPGQVTVLDASKSDVGKVRFEDDKGGFVELSRDGGVVWVRASARGEGKLRTPERELRGSESAEHLLDSFAPLRASRALGVVAADKLKEYGLADEEPKAAPKGDGGVAAAPAPKKPTVRRRILVTARGETRTFTIGSGSSMSPYVRDDGDGRVYLLGGPLVSDLESAATRMVDRTLHTFKPGDFDEITVAATAQGATQGATKKRALRVLSPENPAASKLTSKKTPDKPDDVAKSWHDKVWRLAPVEVLGRGEAPAGGAPPVALRIDYDFHGHGAGWIEIGRVTPPAPAPPPATSAPPPAPPAVEVWARTEHTASWVKLVASSDDLVKEAEKIASAE